MDTSTSHGRPQGQAREAARRRVRPATAPARNPMRPFGVSAAQTVPATTQRSEAIASLDNHATARGGATRGAGSMTAAPMRIGLVDAEAMHAAELAAAIACEPALELSGTASTLEEGLRLARSGVDLLLVDCRLPEGGAASLARSVRRELPSVAIVGLSNHLDRSSRAALVAEGAVGAVDRRMAPEDLAMVVREAFAGPSLLRLAHA